MSERISFGAYLEASGPGEAAREVRERLGQEVMDAARETWAGILSPQTNQEEVKTRLGPPDEVEGSTLAYVLSQRPGYRYVFEFDPQNGLLLKSGYRRIGLPSVIPVPPTDASHWQRYVMELSAVGATDQEVHSWLGDPVERYGWWPTETWEYPNGLLNLRHGVVEADA